MAIEIYWNEAVDHLHLPIIRRFLVLLRNPQFVFTGPGSQFIFTDLGPQFLFNGSGLQFLFTNPGP